jgi:hypothetical protein
MNVFIYLFLWVYFTKLSISQVTYSESNDWMTGDKLDEKNLEGGGRGLIEVLAWKDRGRSLIFFFKIANVQDEIQTKHIPNTSLEHYMSSYTKLLGIFIYFLYLLLIDLFMV